MISITKDNFITECNEDIALQGLIVGSKKAIIIDAGSSVELAKQFMDDAKELIKDKEVILVLTHHHEDHIAGLSVFDIPTILSEKTKQITGFLKGKTFKGSMKIDIGDRIIEIMHIDNPHTEDGTIILDPKNKVLYLGDTIYAILKDGKASRNPDKALKLLDKIDKLDADYLVMFHGGVYKKESMQPYFNTVRMAIKLSKISQDWEVAKTYFEKKHKMTATETLKRLYDSVLNV